MNGIIGQCGTQLQRRGRSWARAHYRRCPPPDTANAVFRVPVTWPHRTTRSQTNVHPPPFGKCRAQTGAVRRVRCQFQFLRGQQGISTRLVVSVTASPEIRGERERALPLAFSAAPHCHRKKKHDRGRRRHQRRPRGGAAHAVKPWRTLLLLVHHPSASCGRIESFVSFCDSWAEDRRQPGQQGTPSGGASSNRPSEAHSAPPGDPLDNSPVPDRPVQDITVRESDRNAGRTSKSFRDGHPSVCRIAVRHSLVSEFSRLVIRWTVTIFWRVTSLPNACRSPF